jgi:glycosidase
MALASVLAIFGPNHAQAEAADARTVTFKYVASKSVHSVYLADSFNGWSKDATPMKLEADGRTWTVQVNVPFGRQQYKFVLDGSDWVVDPNGKPIDDGNGHTNSLLVVMPADFDRPASPDDGIVASSALMHRQSPSFLNYDRGALTLKLRARAGDLKSVSLVINDKSLPMSVSSSDDMYSTYEVSLPWDRSTSLSYGFKLVDGDKTFWYGPSGLGDSESDSFHLEAKEFHPFQVPNWVEKSVIYQIFPDRFANGDKSNDPPNVVSWDSKPTYSNRFGGDIAGVRQHLAYLKDLGITAVYFNPVFQSPSNHRYETTDYRKIDPQFGTNQEFHDLTEAMKSMGIRTIMDFALNHSATNFAPFQDVIAKGAASKFVNWYFIKGYPVQVKENPNYVAWFNYPSMPKLNVMNPETHDYLLGSVLYWLKEAPGLSGLRLDAANEVDMRFWRDLRKEVKGVYPDTWIVGEEWGDASSWLQGDQWDASMNYPFRDACLRFFADKTAGASQFAKALMANYRMYAPQVSRNMMNLIGSHDTARFLTLCKGDVASDELAAATQFSWVGVPSVYYGDEVGMEGGVDPDNRRGMRWSIATASNPVLNFYKTLIHVRETSPALQSGEPRILLTDDARSTVVFSRELTKDVAITALNRSDVEQTVSFHLPDSAPFRAAVRKGFFDALTGRHVSANGLVLSLTLKPMSAEILRPVTSHDSYAGGYHKMSASIG